MHAHIHNNQTYNNDRNVMVQIAEYRHREDYNNHDRDTRDLIHAHIHNDHIYNAL